jgi:cell division protein FtsB
VRRQAARTRRNRLILICSVVVSALIVGAWFPASDLLHERHQLSSATAQLDKVRSTDRSLSKEEEKLKTSAEIARIAQTQDGLAPAGDQLYQVLPQSGVSTATTTTAPVSGRTTTSSHTGDTSSTSDATTAQPGSQPGFFGRIVQTLEFWH